LNALVFFLALDAALLLSAAVLLLAVILRRGRSAQYLGLAVMLIVLAMGVWYTSIRTPPVLP
jgi:ABC-type proline/glycine betaine transport system permease subunit